MLWLLRHALLVSSREEAAGADAERVRHGHVTAGGRAARRRAACATELRIRRREGAAAAAGITIVAEKGYLGQSESRGSDMTIHHPAVHAWIGLWTSKRKRKKCTIGPPNTLLRGPTCAKRLALTDSNGKI